uniref:ATP synthase F0 subunit 8 n=1 Tax=Arma koreana TaxID=1603581 RepID=UPI002E7856F8|nr:ATP synthase F0 subunit 8 [Arma koreana]WPM93260.1 ATP synthase F0 subunit 8 [Arma koreana]
MPQMSPLWWEVLFIIFVMTYFMFNIMIYFNKKNSLINKNSKNNKTNNLNWMW